DSGFLVGAPLSPAASRPRELKSTTAPAVPPAVRPDPLAVGRPERDAVPVGTRAGDGAVTRRDGPTWGAAVPAAAFGLPAGGTIRDQELTVPEPPTKSPTSSTQVPWAFWSARADRGFDGR